MSVKCVNRGCGKLFDPAASGECNYHPDLPDFHEGQKGWKCCKPRVLTFDEFMTIPPCATGSHSAKDDAALAEEQRAKEASAAALKALSISAKSQTTRPEPPAVAVADQTAAPTPAPIADESDDPDAVPTDKAACKRRGCDAVYISKDSPTESACIHHPGHAVFHEGSKGYSCCKRRVLEFDQFLNIEGCKEKPRHCFVGRKKDPSAVEHLASVRHDFYQTGQSVIASLYLKKVDKASSTITFTSPNSIDVNLNTTDNKVYRQTIPLYASIDTEKSTYKILGTKVEFELIKADGTNWAVLKSDDRPTGEIIQTGRAARV